MSKLKIYDTWYGKIVLIISGMLAFLGPKIIGGSVYGVGMEGIYAVILIFSLSVFYKCSFEWRMIRYFGKHTTNIWFLHCIFFAASTNTVFKPILYWPKIPILVFCWGFGLCLVGANLVEKMVDMVNCKVLSW